MKSSDLKHIGITHNTGRLILLFITKVGGINSKITFF